jgi:hypothetical protein
MLDRRYRSKEAGALDLLAHATIALSVDLIVGRASVIRCVEERIASAYPYHGCTARDVHASCQLPVQRTLKVCL